MSTQLASEQLLVNSPMSFAGSLQRINRLIKRITTPWARIIVQAIAYTLIIPLVWCVVAIWYALSYTLFFIPTVLWRMHRRGVRKDKRAALQHRELLDAMRERTS